LEGVDAQTTIAGSTGSTSISSLKLALSQIRFSPVIIPGIKETLIKSASLTFPTDIVQTGIAQSSFTLANPFTASINLLSVGATATYHGLTLGTIDHVDVSANPIHADGHSTVTSQSLPMKYNLDPATIVRFLGIASQSNGVDIGPLAEMFQFILNNPDFHPPVRLRAVSPSIFFTNDTKITTAVDAEKPTCVRCVLLVVLRSTSPVLSQLSGHQFDVAGAILASLKNLKVDLAVDSTVKLDDCEA
jgi:hypothetical protein